MSKTKGALFFKNAIPCIIPLASPIHFPLTILVSFANYSSIFTWNVFLAYFWALVLSSNCHVGILDISCNGLMLGVLITSGKLDISNITSESSICGPSKNGYSKLEEKFGNAITFAFHWFVPTPIVALECFNFVATAH